MVLDEYEKGNIVQLSKEFVRQYYIQTGHQEELRLTRESGPTDPPFQHCHRMLLMTLRHFTHRCTKGYLKKNSNREFEEEFRNFAFQRLLEVLQSS